MKNTVIKITTKKELIKLLREAWVVLHQVYYDKGENLPPHHECLGCKLKAFADQLESTSGTELPRPFHGVSTPGFNATTPKPKIEKLPPWKRGTWDMEGIIDKINENTDAINEIRGSK